MGQLYDLDYNRKDENDDIKMMLIMTLEFYRGVIPDYEEMLISLGLDPYYIFDCSVNQITDVINFLDSIFTV